MKAKEFGEKYKLAKVMLEIQTPEQIVVALEGVVMSPFRKDGYVTVSNEDGNAIVALPP